MSLLSNTNLSINATATTQESAQVPSLWAVGYVISVAMYELGLARYIEATADPKIPKAPNCQSLLLAHSRHQGCSNPSRPGLPEKSPSRTLWSHHTKKEEGTLERLQPVSECWVWHSAVLHTTQGPELSHTHGLNQPPRDQEHRALLCPVREDHKYLKIGNRQEQRAFQNHWTGDYRRDWDRMGSCLRGRKTMRDA